MKRILLLTMALMALVAGKAQTTYSLPADLTRIGYDQMTGKSGTNLVTGDVLNFTGDVVTSLVIPHGVSELTIKGNGYDLYTNISSTIETSGKIELILDNVTIRHSGLYSAIYADSDIEIITKNGVTVQSPGNQSTVYARSSFTLTCMDDNTTQFIGSNMHGQPNAPVVLINSDKEVTIRGGKPEFIGTITSGATPAQAFDASQSNVTITDSDPTFTGGEGMGLVAKNLTIDGTSSPTFTSAKNYPLSLGGDLTLSTSGNITCSTTSTNMQGDDALHFQNNTSGTVFTIDVTGFSGEFNLTSENDLAINSYSHLIITGESDGGKINANGSISASGYQVLLEIDAKIEITTSGISGSNGVIIENATINSTSGLSNATIKSGTVTVSGSLGFMSTLTIEEGGTLIIPEGKTASANYASVNIVNEGTFTVNGTFENKGVITNEGEILNAGTITNAGTLTNQGTLTNSAGAEFTNVADATLDNTGEVNNAGTLSNNGTLTNETEGAITNETGAIFTNETDATINNKGTLTVNEDITNSGVINNYNTIEGDGEIINEGNGKVIEHSQNSTYHTIALTIAEGIDCNYSTSELTIPEGDHIFLQFSAEEYGLTPADILFLIDGVETDFTTSGNGGSYILNPIIKDQTILIALREYPVTFPEIEGLTITPQGKAKYGEAFTFIINSKTLDLSQMKVFANGTELTPNTFRAENYTYTIECITCPLDITIEGANPTSNAHIASGKVSIAMDNGQLRIENSGNAVDIAVYTIAGKNVVSLRGLRGSRTFALLAGIYIVRAGNTTNKLIIQN